jgi:hypothetical protein
MNLYCNQQVIFFFFFLTIDVWDFYFTCYAEIVVKSYQIKTLNSLVVVRYFNSKEI